MTQAGTIGGRWLRGLLFSYHVLLLAVDQLTELFLTFDRVGVVRVKLVDGVLAFNAHVLGQLVGAGDADLQALGDLAGQLVEHADRPVGYGHAQPAHFRQVHVGGVTLTLTGSGANGPAITDGQRQRATGGGGTVNSSGGCRGRRQSCWPIRISRAPWYFYPVSGRLRCCLQDVGD